jgi:hypothetical protein
MSDVYGSKGCEYCSVIVRVDKLHEISVAPCYAEGEGPAVPAFVCESCDEMSADGAWDEDLLVEATLEQGPTS